MNTKPASGDGDDAEDILKRIDADLRALKLIAEVRGDDMLTVFVEKTLASIDRTLNNFSSEN